MPSTTNITPPRVPLTDPRTGLVSREWYMFFVSLFQLTGAGQNLASLTDLQVGPPTIEPATLAGILGEPLDSPLVAQLVVVAKQIQALAVVPPTVDSLPLQRVVQGLQVAPPPSAAFASPQGLQVGPPAIPNTNGRVMTNTATLDFPNTAAQSSSDLTVSVPGAVDGDAVALGVPNSSILVNSDYFGWVSAPDTVTVRYNNYSSAAQDPPSGVFRAMVTRL